MMTLVVMEPLLFLFLFLFLRVMMKIKVLDQELLEMSAFMVKSFFYSYEWFVILFNSNDSSSFIATPPHVAQRPTQPSKLLLFSSNYLQFLAVQIIASISPFSARRGVTRPFGCNLCVPRNTFSTIVKLREHQEGSHFFCEICVNFFKTEPERDNHLRVHQAPEPDSIVVGGSSGDVLNVAFYCASCHRNCSCSGQ